MFKLAELFVDIQAPIAPVTKALDSVKSAVTSTASVATSAAKGIGAAFSAVLGPIGIAAKAFEILAPLIDTQSEALTELKGYWEEIKKTVSEALSGMATETIEYLKSLVEMVTSNEMVVAAFNTLKEYGTAAIENVKIAIENAIVVIKQFGSASMETFKGLVIILGDVYASIQKALGIDAAKSATTWGQTIQTWVIDKVELLGILVRNLPTFFEIAAVQIEGVFRNMGAHIQNFFVSMVDSTLALFEKLASLLGSQGKFLTELIKDARVDLQKMSAPVGDFGKAKLEELYKKIADEEAMRNRPKRKALEEYDEEDEPAVAAAAAVAKLPGMGFKTESFGVADLASKMRAGILNKESDDKMTKQLLAQERTAKAVEKMNEKMDKPKPATVA